ncbi:MAG TPA: hypothetical protein VMI75_34475 [Polyangiaceae bacterium]|nr:hypothetical protein [Polyangiaceae bacterium]
MTILVKGGEVDLILVDDNRSRRKSNTIVLPTGYGMCHDESGRNLPRCSVFFGPIVVTDERVEKLPKDAALYFGDDYEARKARIDVPDGKWKSVGKVTEIIYYRPGRYEHDWRHEFETPVALFKQGRWYAMKLPRGCRVTWRGFEKP